MGEEVVRFRSLIGGEWVGGGRETFRSTDPATGEVVGEGPLNDVDDVSRAVEAAREAFPRWRAVPAPSRAEIVRRAAMLLQERQNSFARLVTREMGKTLREGVGDVQEAIEGGFFAAAEGYRLVGETTPSKIPDKFVMTIRDPVGVVAAISPWNFPLATPAFKVFPALVAGDTVVLKPSPYTPVVAYEFVRLLFDEIGLPPGVLNLVYGDAPVGEALVSHPGVDIISFTGSSQVGRQIAIRAAEQFKRVSLELGGKNAIIVMDDADLDLALASVIWTAYATSGQRCSSCSRVIVQKGVASEFTQRVAEKAAALRVGNGLLPDTGVGPVIDDRAVERCIRYCSDAVRDGARLLIGGKPLTEGEYAKGSFFAPTVFDRVDAGSPLAQDEIFGPVLGVIQADSLEEALRIDAGTKYGLISSVFTRDLSEAFRAIRDCTSGVIHVNYGTAGAEVQVPFVGTGVSGNGLGDWDVLTRWKSVYVDYSGRLQRVHVDDAPPPEHWGG